MVESRSRIRNPHRASSNRMNLDLTDAASEWLHDQATAEERPMMDVVRAALDLYKAFIEHPGAEMTYENTDGKKVRLMVLGITGTPKSKTSEVQE